MEAETSLKNGENTLLQGLQQLVAGAFPRSCPTCGRHYETFEQFLQETQPLPNRKCVKASEDEAGSSLLEVYRNCVCGSTLMDLAQDRRNQSETGKEGRLRFAETLDRLMAHGMDEGVARLALRKVMRGQGSAEIEALLLQLKKR